MRVRRVDFDAAVTMWEPTDPSCRLQGRNTQARDSKGKKLSSEKSKWANQPAHVNVFRVHNAGTHPWEHL